MRLAIWTVLALMLSLRLLGSSAAESPRPNILYFYVDDMGWGSIGPNGQAERQAKGLPFVRTPNLDQLAAQGVNFTRGYGCHVCSPARSSQQSGFHQGHTFADRNDPNNAKKAMRADDILMGDALSAAGYATGYWGKWGYGGSKAQDNPTLDNLQTLPTAHGYQHVIAELHHVRAHTFFQPTLWSAPAAPNAIGRIELAPNSMAKYQNNALYPNEPALQNHEGYPTTAYCDDSYAFAALDFVRHQGQNYNQNGQPFFGLLAVQIPHAPFQEIATLPEWDREYADDPKFAKLADQTRQWAAMVTRIDAHFGNILDALEDPNSDGDTSDSIASNTLVIFQSDNGGPGGKNNVELDANGGLRGNKGQIYEGGIRVPLVMRWPAKISTKSRLRAGSNCDRVVDVTDLLPTFCELAGTQVPLGIDGVSIAPTLTGSGHQRSREFIIHEAGNSQSIIRGKHKLVRSDKSPLQLFDLEADPAEQQNIAPKHPEMVAQLENLLIGERVTEPRGFANTYHAWQGRNGDSTSNANNWTDYEYSNAGITYMHDDGAPQLSWVAKMHNASSQSQQAIADSNVELLALEIAGNPSSNATQELVVQRDVELVARNGLRLSPHASLNVTGGHISTLRWIDIASKAAWHGSGSLRGSMQNNGLVSLEGSSRPSLDISGDYRQSNSAILALKISPQSTPMTIAGTAVLDGSVTIRFPDGNPKPGDSFTLLSATEVSGKFAQLEHSSSHGRLSLQYTPTEVRLIVN